MKLCVAKPRLKSGEISPLYIQLKKFFGNHLEAMKWYTRAMSTDFSKSFSNIPLDENNEPSFEDLLNKVGLKKAKEESRTLKDLNKQYEIEAPKNYNGVKEVQSSIVAFNKNNPLKEDYVATLEEYEDKVRLVIKPRREVRSEESSKIAINNTLNKKLETLLNSWGISVGALSRLEERLGINGVTDFNVALKVSEGLKEVIRIAKGLKGQKALPEEFAHFAVEAIGEVPLKSRILNVLKNEEVIKRILGDTYDRYYKLYNGNLDLLASEVLGKLVAKSLNDENVFIPNKNLFDRYLTSLKNLFSNHNTDEIDSIINETMKEVYALTNNIVNNRYSLETSNISYTNKMYNVNTKVERDSKLLKRIIEQELKRLKVYGTKEEFNVTQTAFISELQSKLDEHLAIDGIYEYIKNSLEVLGSLNKRLKKLESGELTQQEKFNTLRNIRNYISSYGVILEEIKKESIDASREDDNRLKEKLKVLLNDNLDLLASLSRDFYSISKSEFTDFIRPFVGEGLAITLGNYKGKVYTAEELISSMDRDITIFDRWLDSMADSSDPMLQIYDQVVKKQKGLARLDTIELQKKIEKKTRELELAGVKDTSFMFERDENGNLTGYYLQKTWWNKYYKARKNFFDSLSKKYGENPEGNALTAKNKEIYEWYKENTVKDENNMRIPNSKYDNPAYSKLNKAQLEYHDFIMDTKKELDTVLPTRNDVHLAPQIRRDFLDRALNSNNKAKYFWESMKDTVIKREDEDSMGGTDEYNSAVIDFEGNEVMRLPIYYTRKLEDMNDLSTDVASTMIAYASMANDFDRMNEVIDTLEVGKLLLAEREVTQTRGGKSKAENFTILGQQIHNILTKKGGENYFLQKLNTFMEMQVYGRGTKDEGSVGKLDIAKSANLLNKMTSYSTTALSLLTGMANAVQNVVMSNIEAVSGRYFNVKELAFADSQYAKELPSFLGEFGDRIKTNKLALFSELFNVPQDYKQHVRNVNFNKKNWATRLMNENSLFFTTQAGDHWTQHRIAIALASRIPMIYNGEKTNLWDVLEVVPVDSNNPKLGASLQVKKGATKADGTEFSKDDIITLSNKIRATENMLYGIYNSEDKNALQQVAAGRLIMMFRNWMRPLWLARFGRGKYSYDLGDYVEGYYQTMWRFLSNNIKDLRQSEFDIVKNWNNLEEVEKANIRKGLTEIATYWSLYLMISMIEGFEDDDKKKPWALRLASYTALRLRTDMGALLPSPTMLYEGQKLFDSPFAAITTIRKITNTIKLVNPVVIFGDNSPYTKEINSGMYKDYMEWQKILIDLLPFRKQIVNAFGPEEPAKWYK